MFLFLVTSFRPRDPMTDKVGYPKAEVWYEPTGRANNESRSRPEKSYATPCWAEGDLAAHARSGRRLPVVSATWGPGYYELGPNSMLEVGPITTYPKKGDLSCYLN